MLEIKFLPMGRYGLNWIHVIIIGYLLKLYENYQTIIIAMNEVTTRVHSMKGHVLSLSVYSYAIA